MTRRPRDEDVPRGRGPGRAFRAGGRARLILAAALAAVPARLRAATAAPSAPDSGASADARSGRSGSAADPAAADPWSRVYAGLETALGRDVLSRLASRGYLVVSPEKPQVLYVQWAALEPLASAAAALAPLAEEAAAFRAKGDVPASDGAARAAESLPASGLLTPGVQAAAAVLSEAVSHKAALAGRSLGRLKPLYRAPWGKRFAALYHAETLEDPSPLVAAFFDGWLAGPDRVPEAADHVKDYFKTAYGEDVGPALDRAIAAGSTDEQLRGRLAAYLSDQRRWARLLELREEWTSLGRRTETERELSDLASTAKALASARGALETAKAELPEPGRPCAKTPGAPCVNGGDLHLQPAAGSSGLELGGKAAVSAAYWIEGLAPEASADVVEAGFIDRGEEGLQEAQIKTVSRRLGGPYGFTTEVPLRDTRAFTYKLILAAPGQPPVVKAVDVSPGARAEDALRALARTDGERLACKLRESATDYALLERDASPADKSSPEARLAVELPRRIREASRAAEAYDKLARLLTVARMDASSDACAYRTDRAEKARAALSDLPAGCSASLGEEADGLLRASGLRREDQDDFDRTAESARDLEKSCRFQDAGARYAAALAVLDADHEAHCGRWEADYKTIRDADLPRAAALESFQSVVDRTLADAHAAEKGGDHEGALAKLLPLIARIDALPSARCWDKPRREADEMAEAAGLALAPRAPEAVAARLPADDPDAVLAEIKANKARLEREAAQRASREQEAQAPMAPVKSAAAAGNGAAAAPAAEESPAGPPSGPAVPPAVQSEDVPVAPPPPAPAPVKKKAAKTRRKAAARKKRHKKTAAPADGPAVAPDAGDDAAPAGGRPR